MKLEEDAFLEQPCFAVAGASTDRDKYGNKVVRAYLQNDKVVFPINPKEAEVEGQKSYRDVASVPRDDFALSIVTPPRVTLEIVRAALRRGVRHMWMQPGAENPEAVEEAKAAGASVIHGGSCVLVALGFRE